MTTYQGVTLPAGYTLDENGQPLDADGLVDTSFIETDVTCGVCGLDQDSHQIKLDHEPKCTG